MKHLKEKSLRISVTPHPEYLIRIQALGMTLLHWGKGVTGGSIPHILDPTTNFRKLQTPTPMDSMEFVTAIAVMAIRKEPAVAETGFMEFQLPTFVRAT